VPFTNVIMNLILFLLISVLQVAQSQDTSTCAAESAVINTDSTMIAAVSAFTEEATASLQNIQDICNIFQRSCSKDLGTMQSSTDLKVACGALGGQIVEKDARLKCTGSISNVPIPGGFTAAVANFPACVGVSCDPDNLPDEVGAVFGTVLDNAEQEIEDALGESVTCEASAGLRTAMNNVSLVLSTLFLAWIIV
jgi:hypothetical protein